MSWKRRKFGKRRVQASFAGALMLAVAALATHYFQRGGAPTANNVPAPTKTAPHNGSAGDRRTTNATVTSQREAAPVAANRSRESTSKTPSTPSTSSAAGEPPPFPKDRLCIGGWNIEWLGTPGSRSGKAENIAQKPEDIAAYIVAAKVDVLGICEIGSSASSGGRESDEMAAALRLVDRQTGGKWDHRLFPARSGRNQQIGLAWNTLHVRPVGPPVKVTEPSQRSTDGRVIWSRPPWGQLFSAGPGRTDFAVIVVHMKSDYRGDFSAQRESEAKTLLADLPRAFSDADVVIIGDFNCGSHREPAIKELTGGGFIDLNADDSQTHIAYGPLDRALTPAAQPEFAQRIFRVERDEFLRSGGLSLDDFKRRFSDHFMVVTELQVMADDD